MEVEKRRRFLIHFAYFAVLFGLSVVLVRYALPVLVPFLIAFLVSLFLKPVVRLLYRKCRLPKSVSSVIVVLLFYGTIGILVVLGVIWLFNYAKGLIGLLPNFYKNTLEPSIWKVADSIEQLVEHFNESSNFTLDNSVNELLSSLGTAVSNFSVKVISAAGNTAFSVPGFLLNVLITIVSTVFFTTDSDMLRAFLDKQLKPERSSLLHKVASQLGRVVRKYIFSYMLILVITFCEIFVGLLIIRVPNAALYALLIAIFDLLPVVGSGTIIVPWAVISLLSGMPGRGLGLAILWVVIIVVRYIIEPKIIGDHVGLHPLATLIAMIAGNFIYGAVGILLVPLTLALCQNLNKSGVIHLYDSLSSEEAEGEKVETLGALLLHRAKKIVRKKPKD